MLSAASFVRKLGCVYTGRNPSILPMFYAADATIFQSSCGASIVKVDARLQPRLLVRLRFRTNIAFVHTRDCAAARQEYSHTPSIPATTR